MKSINKYLIASLICLLSFYACDESKLELVNPNLSSPETFLETPSQVQSAVNAIYANLQTRGLYARHMFFSMDNMGHDNDGNDQLEADKRQYLEFSFDASHGAIRAFWESCYRGINKANYFITNQEKIAEIPDGQLSQALKDSYHGEAKFLRAFYYFLLVTRYGDVPLLTELPTTGDGTPKSPKEEVYQQIISDLQDAASKLVAKTDPLHQSGRATKGAAYALLGKVHLYRGEYSLAKTAFQNILSGQYSLVPEYIDNFLEETEFNDESIFEVVYQEDLGTGSMWNSDADGLGLTEATFRGQEYGCLDWFNVYPSDVLLDAFEVGDPRYTFSFYSEGDAYSGGTISMTPARRAGWRKYQNYYKEAAENLYSSINFRIIRFSDVLLMMAEIENELGNSSVAIDYLNDVRNRPSVSMPNYGTAEMDAIYPVGTKAEIFAAIVHERQVELAGEQARFPDLVRWGLADQELSQFGFTTGKNEVFPIPQNEINSNNALTDDDQNPNY